jgi:hypothetical protein
MSTAKIVPESQADITIDATGIKIARKVKENVFEKYRGTGNGLPEVDGTIDDIVRYMRELRGHDEIDALM